MRSRLCQIYTRNSVIEKMIAKCKMAVLYVPPFTFILNCEQIMNRWAAHTTHLLINYLQINFKKTIDSLKIV
jgi:hypothetical protein